MPTPSSRRSFARPALLLPFLALACNNPPPPTTPDPPQVSIIVDEPNSVGKGIKLFVTTSGCDQVQRLELLDNNELLKQVTYGATPTQVELATSDLRYTRGLSANLSLTARVTCDDGRTNVSQAQPATFLPVDEVVELAPLDGTAPVVPDYFVVDGSGANASFIGCRKVGAQYFLYKLNRAGTANPAPLEMDFPCDATTLITDRRPAVTGWRWVWTKDKGAFAIDASFKITARWNQSVQNLAVTPDGKAFIYDVATLTLLDPTNTVEPVWELNIGDPEGIITSLVLADPYVRPDGRVAIPFYDDGIDETHIRVGTVRYSDGQDLKMFDVDTIQYIQRPPVAFDPTGKVLYLATQGTTSATVRACGFEEGKCIPSEKRLWISQELPGYMAALVPYNNGSRLAAIGSNRFWFLEARSGQSNAGQAVNKDQLPLTSNGALVARFAQQGPDSAFYMFNSAAATDEKPWPYPVEIVATDAAEKGELFRYQVPGGSLYGAVDDTEALWLRVGSKLVKLFAPEQYRVMR